MTAREIMVALAEHFPAKAISWRPGATFDRDGVKHARALAYIDARDVMERLDKVMGADWQCEYVPMPNGTCCCRIGLKIDGEWRWRSNGAGATDVEAEKGSYSDAMKRAAVLWGVGQYLYSLGSPIVRLAQQGRSWVIDKSEQPKLDALLVRNGAPAAQSTAEPPAPQPSAPAQAAPSAPKTPAVAVKNYKGAHSPAPAGNHQIDKRRSMALSDKMRTTLGWCDSSDKLKAWENKWRPEYKNMTVEHRALVTKAYNARKDALAKAGASEAVDPETGEIKEAAA